MSPSIITRTIFVALAIGFAHPTPADSITEEFSGTVLDGRFAGTPGTGSFRYNSDLVDVEDAALLNLYDLEALDFTIFGQTFAQTDVAYGLFPFQDGVAVGAAFVIYDEVGGNGNPNNILKPGIIAILVNLTRPVEDVSLLNDLSISALSSFHADITIYEPGDDFPVPEVNSPAPLLGVALGLTGLRSWRRRQARTT